VAKDSTAHPPQKQQQQQQPTRKAPQRQQQPAQGVHSKPEQNALPVAFWDFKKRVAYRHVAGKLQETSQVSQLRPEAGSKSPVLAKFGETECRLSAVWWEIVSAAVVPPATPVYRKIKVTRN
jgi:hypothetical protein